MSKPWEFEPSDFDPKTGPADDGKDLCSYHWAARIANAKLKEWIEGANMVYAPNLDLRSTWGMYGPGHSHFKARLIMVEPIVRDSAESLIKDARELCALMSEGEGPNPEVYRMMANAAMKQLDRARKLLEK